MTGWLLHNVSTIWILVIVVVVPTALSVLGLWLVRRRFSWETLAANNEQGGVLFSVVGTIYAIFLAFLVVVAWEQLGEAEKTVTEEGATVVSLYRDVGVFPEQARRTLRAGLREYVAAVVDDEWNTMAHGEESPVAHDRFEAVWAAFLTLEPATPREQIAYAEAFTRLNELAKQRKVRIQESEASLPEIFWFLLVVGAIVTIGLTYFMGMRSRAAQMTMTGVLTMIIALGLFLIVLLDHPFTGDVRSEPTAFRQALVQMQGVGS